MRSWGRRPGSSHSLLATLCGREAACCCLFREGETLRGDLILPFPPAWMPEAGRAWLVGERDWGLLGLCVLMARACVMAFGESEGGMRREVPPGKGKGDTRAEGEGGAERESVVSGGMKQGETAQLQGWNETGGTQI